MKPLSENHKYRQRHPTLGWGDHEGGYFYLPGGIRVIVSSGAGWDHVSVSLNSRCPTWEEMERVKRMFFKDGECVMQLHPPLADYIDRCKYCLHLWRPQNETIPRPPGWMVG